MKLKRFLENPHRVFSVLANRGLLNWQSDERFLKLQFRARMGKPLNLKEPRTFNEKLQWLKLYDRKPEYTQMVDKYEVKAYVAKLIGEEYIIPTLGVWDRFEDIDFDVLPAQFVLKCTHDSGGLVICKDKSKLDKAAAKAKIEKSLKRNYYLSGREWPYKNVKPRIIAEKYMVDESGIELKDYKVFCYNGQPKAVQVDFDRFIEHKRNVYSPQWELLDVGIQYPRDPNRIIEKPKKLEEMLRLAERLSTGIPHIRTDFYIIKDKIYFGELTFYHGSGYEKFTPEEWDVTFGSWIRLPKHKRGVF